MDAQQLWGDNAESRKSYIKNRLRSKMLEWPPILLLC